MNDNDMLAKSDLPRIRRITGAENRRLCVFLYESFVYLQNFPL